MQIVLTAEEVRAAIVAKINEKFDTGIVEDGDEEIYFDDKKWTESTKVVIDD